MIIKEFKNGNFNIKRDTGDTDALLLELLNSSEADFYLVALHESVGNFTTANTLYNAKTGLMYTLLDNLEKNYIEGETIKLIGYKYDKEDYAGTEIYSIL